MDGEPHSSSTGGQAGCNGRTLRVMWKLFLLASIALLGASECVQVGLPKFGRIEVSAFSILGERLANLRIELRDSGTNKSVDSLFSGSIAKKVPYGTYVMRVSAPGFRSVQREVRLYQPDLQIRSQFSVSVECGGFHEITGTVRPIDPNAELWIKLVPVRGTGGADVRVARNGTFLASGLDDGHYLLLVVDGTTILHTQTVEAPRRIPVAIDLARKQAP
jgi:hypothetical protein